MIPKRKILLSLLLIPLTFSAFVSPTKALSPFWVEVTPATSTVKPGDNVTYHVKVDAFPYFTDKLFFTLKVTALSYGVTLDLGSLNPPYPKEFDYSFKIPQEIPTEITAKGIITATNGTLSYTKEVEITVKSAAEDGDIFAKIVKIFVDFWNWLMGVLGIRRT